MKISSVMVSVPSFGDSFLCPYLSSHSIFFSRCFRPLIRGFFFYNLIAMQERCDELEGFPSPHSGILFFILQYTTQMNTATMEFPSPHSGILFLSCRYDMPPSLNIFAIFRRILHLLAQKGFPLTQSIHFSPYPSASARIKSFFHPYCTVSNSS